MGRRQLAVQVGAFAPAFFAAAHFLPGLAGCFTGLGGLDRLLQEGLADLRILLQENPQLLRHDGVHRAPGRCAAQLVLGLADKLNLAHFDIDDGHHAFP
ncbi:hypothetical protein D3C75_735870 [compost metagenome]